MKEPKQAPASQRVHALAQQKTGASAGERGREHERDQKVAAQFVR